MGHGDKAKNAAISQAIRILKSCTSWCVVVPGAPARSSASTGKEKSFAKDNTAIAESVCRVPAMMLSRRNVAEVVTEDIGIDWSDEASR